MTRAILFASATATTLEGRFLLSRSCHADGAFPRARAERAPWTNKVRTYLSPHFEMPSICTRPPVPVCRGTRPNQAANSRPLLNAAGSPIVVIAAVAVSTPTPGIAASRRLAAFSRCQRRDPPFNPIALGIQLRHARPLFAERLDDHRRQPLRDPLENPGHLPLHPGAAAGHDLAVFRQQDRAGR